MTNQVLDRDTAPFANGTAGAPLRREMAVLFVDLVGFTGASERAGLDATYAMLDRFYEVVDGAVAATRGTVMAYLGDGAMAVYRDASARCNARRAISASYDLAHQVVDWLAGLDPAIAPAGVRIGTHYGDVIVATAGGTVGTQVTVLGDTVNVANRLLDVASENRGDVALSERLVEAADLPPELVDRMSRCRLVPIRGRAKRLRARVLTPGDWRALPGRHPTATSEAGPHGGGPVR